MPRRLTALLLALLATGGMTACGGGEEIGDVVPRETPELATPGEGSTTLPAASADAAVTPDATPAPTPAAPTQQTPAPTQDSGGTAAPQTGGGTGTTGGGTADPGGFSDFCTQNPGACDN